MGGTLFAEKKGEEKLKIIYVPDYDTLSKKTAMEIAAQLIQKPDSILGLATGSSPIGAYEYLARWYQAGDLDFSQARSVNLDEYCGLSGDHPQSYRYFMEQNLFSKVNFAETFLPNGIAEDLAEESRRYEKILRRYGPIDLQLLGIGHNGHIGFNEPSDEFVPETHVVGLKKSTIEANARFFDDPSQGPKQAITMGIRAIMQAKKVLLMAGDSKEEIIRKALFGPVTPQVPASILQLHPDLTVVTTAKPK